MPLSEIGVLKQKKNWDLIQARCQSLWAWTCQMSSMMFWLLFDFVKIIVSQASWVVLKVLVMDTTALNKLNFCDTRLWTTRTWKIHLQCQEGLCWFSCFEIWSGIYIYFLVMISLFVVLALGKAFLIWYYI